MSWSPDKFSLCPLFQLDPYPKVGSEKEKEIYVYLYRSDKVLLLKNVVLYPDPKNNFIREPFIAMFKAGNFDFYAINIHTIYGKNINERRHEAEKLAEVYKSVQDRDKENDVLLMGDFNLPPDDNGFPRLKAIPSMIFIDGKIPTTIKDQFYDNIWFQSKYTKEYTGKFGVVKFDENMFGNNDEKAKLAVSDHRPLWAVFDVSKDDD